MAKIIEALTNLFKTLNDVFGGPQGVWEALGLLLFVAAAWLWWSERSRKKASDRTFEGYRLYTQQLIDAVRSARIETMIARGRTPEDAAAAVDAIYPSLRPPQITQEPVFWARLFGKGKSGKGSAGAIANSSVTQPGTIGPGGPQPPGGSPTSTRGSPQSR